MSGAVEGVDFIQSSTRRVAFRSRTVLNSQQLSDFYAGRPVDGAKDVPLTAAPVVVDRMDDPLERWLGYHEQSWQERFNELNRRYNERTVQLDAALYKVALARLTTPPARSYADEDVARIIDWSAWSWHDRWLKEAETEKMAGRAASLRKDAKMHVAASLAKAADIRLLSQRGKA